MAIQIDIPDPTTGNTVATYARIDSMMFNRTNRLVHLEVQFYKNRRARQEGRQPLSSRVIEIRGGDYDTHIKPVIDAENGAGIVRAAYVYLKSLDTFSAGTDVLE